MARRAQRGSLQGHQPLVLRAPPELRADVRRIAEAEGVTESEVWRRAGQREVDRVKRRQRREAAQG